MSTEGFGVESVDQDLFVKLNQTHMHHKATMDGNFFTSNTTHDHHGHLFKLTDHPKANTTTLKKKNPIYISIKIQTHNKQTFKIATIYKTHHPCAS